MKNFIYITTALISLTCKADLFECNTQLLSMPKLIIQTEDHNSYKFMAKFNDSSELKEVSHTLDDNNIFLYLGCDKTILEDAKIIINNEMLEIALQSPWEYEYYASEVYSLELPMSGLRKPIKCSLTQAKQ